MMRSIVKYFSWLHTYTLSWAVTDSTIVSEWKADGILINGARNDSLNNKSERDHNYI